MGTRYKKSIKAGPLRVNLSKSGIGYSVGTKGFRYTKKAGGGTRTTASIPGTGISYVKDTGKKKTGSAAKQHTQGAAVTMNNNNGQRKAARILCLMAGIPICIFAVLVLLCGEFMIFAIFGVIGALFLYAAKKLKCPPDPSVNNALIEEQLSASVISSAKKSIQGPADSTTARIRTAQANKTNAREAADTSVEKTYRVAGTTFHADNIMNLAVENPDYDCSKKELIDDSLINERVWQYEFDPTDVKLVPEPENPEDTNAIKVVVDGEHIGYIKSGFCAHIHKLLKENRILSISCKIGGGPYKYISEEYDEDKDKDVFVLERGRANFFATLTIRESKG